MTDSDGPGPVNEPGGGRKRPGAGGRPWQSLVHRGAQGLALASLALALVLGYRAVTAGPAFATNGRGPVLLLLALLALALAGSVAALRPERGHTPALVKTMAAWAVALAGALVLVWFLANTVVRSDPWVGTPLLTPAEVDRVLATHLGPGADGAPPLLVPTGILVQSLEFLGANNVQVTGYVWQQYGPEVPEDITRGIVFPEAVTEAYGAEEVYRADQGDTELIGWYFHATFRQPFDYSQYPFDRQDVWIRLWHPNFERDVLLVPDFAAYRNLDPRSLPGLEEQFVYGEWEPMVSAFSFVDHHYNTTFGFDPGSAEGVFPELYFNLALKRSFLGPFVDQVLFAAAVALMLFLVLVLTASDEDRKTRFGFSPSGALGATSGLLFAVILKHAQLRAAIGQQGIAYLEVLPLLFYLVIPLVAVNAIVLAAPWHVPVVEWNHNLLPKLLYWPLLLGLLLAVTLAVFFL